MTENGQITIPKKIEQQLNLIEGHYLYIYPEKESVIITTHHLNNTLNQCIYRKGRVSIPLDIRRLAEISLNTTLSVTVDVFQANIVIKTDRKR